MTRRHVLLALAVLHSATLLAGSTAAVSMSAPSPAVVPAPAPAVEPAAPRLVRVAPRPVTRPTPPRPAPRRVSQPVQVDRDLPVVRRVAEVLRQSRTSASPGTLLRDAIDKLPGYRTGDARITLVPGIGSWGRADLRTGRISISPTVPASKMYDVVAHEWSHVLSVKAYDGDVSAALEAMNEWFGGEGMTGAERAADCMALEVGADWTHYTDCERASWRSGARRLLARQAL